MERVFRGPTTSLRDLLIGLVVAIAWARFIGASNAVDVVVSGSIFLSPAAASLVSRVRVGRAELTSRGVVRRRRIALDDIRQVGADDGVVILIVATTSGEREIRLPAVADAEELERLLRDRAGRRRIGPPPSLAASDIVIRQGGLVRRWSGQATYRF
ncbi:MAG: hypothetical protein AAGF02_02535 [Actinomycetota bacterium]